MQIRIESADMTYTKEDGYLGHVVFAVENHPKSYEITLLSKSARDWSYSLNFARESGDELLIEAVEEALEEDDRLFDSLVEAAMAALDK
ncbi:hypothetical protein ACFFK0_11480 [Paenibacillus chartarius]|uniref:DUF1292 domain-containing protein n=1 Tax=Paenibacillus chartarius TaxID=747481 RepID=A0ABV6DKB6_9BACL